MTGYEKIKEQILSDAEKSAKKSIKRAELESAEIINASKKEADEKKTVILEKAEKEAVELKSRILAMNELDLKKEVFKSKQEMVETAFEKAIDKISSMDNVKYEKMLISMISELIETGDEEIILCEKDKERLSKSFIGEVNKIAKSKGMQGNIKLSCQSADIKGGFILKSGDVQINSSLETMVRTSRHLLEAKVMELIFSKN